MTPAKKNVEPESVEVIEVLDLDEPTVVDQAVDRRRRLLAGIIAILGGYLTILAIGGQLIQQLLGFGGPVEFTVLFSLQLIFAVAVTGLGFFLVPGPLGRRVIAKVVYIVGIAVLVLVLVLRLGGGGGALVGNQFVAATFSNVFFMVLLFGALGWLIASGARPFAYLALVLAAVVAPVGLLFALNNVSNGISYLVQLVVAAIAAGVILLVSLPRGSSDDTVDDTTEDLAAAVDDV